MPRGQVSEALVDFHEAVARGGAAMTTVAYCAVSPGGRVHRDTVVLDADRAEQLRKVTSAVHDAGALACAQIGHAGLVANTLSNRTPTLAPSTRLSAPAMGLVRGATGEQLESVVDDFGAAAAHAVDAGFDAIEIHMGHGYLLSSFFSPKLNKRMDRYGGDVARRAELARRVAERVRRSAGENVTPAGQQRAGIGQRRTGGLFAGRGRHRRRAGHHGAHPGAHGARRSGGRDLRRRQPRQVHRLTVALARSACRCRRSACISCSECTDLPRRRRRGIG